VSVTRREMVEQLFVELMDVETSRREEVARQRCQDPEVLREVLGLLGHHDRAENFLDSQALRRTRPAMESYEHWRRLRVGGYSILGVLGTGGMGLVYLAEQQRPRRKVALKVMRVGGNSRSMLSRFQREAELLGSLHHPGIAQVYEAGVAEQELEGGEAGDPLPYMAMELVEGKPLVEYATTANNGVGIGIRAKIELILRICAAVEHAHLRGVIHRDLKPANILVTAEGQPKILDFGVARAMKSDGTAELERTLAGQLLGTLPYMSPEQVAGKSEGVDTRSDVYSVGVLLYELLSGEHPVDLRDCGIEEAGRRIREVEPLSLGRRNPELRGDLEAIAGKALEKDPQRRYQSVAELRSDLENYMRGEAVTARGDRTWYLARKRVRRYWKYYAAGLAAFASLSVFAVTAYQQSISQKRAKNEALSALDQARTAREAADVANQKLEVQLRTASIEKARLLGLTGQRREAERLIWSEHFKNPESPQTRWALWELYSRHACRYWNVLGEGTIARLAVIPGTREVLAGNNAGEAFTIDVDTGAMRTYLGRFPTPIYCVAANGRELAVGTRAGDVIRWKLGQEKPFARVNLFAGSIYSLLYTSDGTLLSGSTDGIVRAWDQDQTPTEVAKFARADGAPLVVDVLLDDPDGWTFLAGLRDGRICRVNPAGGEILAEGRPHNGQILSMCWSPEHDVLLSGGVDQRVAMLSASDLKVLNSAGTLNGSARDVIFLPEGKEFLFVGWSRVEVWERERFRPTGRTIGSAQGWRAGVSLPDTGELVLAPDDSPGITLWELNSRIPAVDNDLPNGVIDHRRMGTHVVTAVRGGVIVRDPSREESSKIFTIPGKRILGMGVAGKVEHGHIGVSVDGGEFRVLDGSTGAEILAIKPPSSNPTDEKFWGEINWPVLSDDGRRAFAITSKRKILFMNLETGEVRIRDMGAGNMLMSSMDVGGKIGAIIHQNPGSVEIWDFEKAERIARSPINAAPLGIALSSDARLVAVAGWDRLAHIFNTTDGKEELTLAGHLDLVLGVAFLDGDQQLATASREGSVRIWDLKTGDSLATLPSASANIRFMRPMPDSVIAGVGWDGVVRYWDMRAYVPHILGNAQEQIRRFKEAGGDADWMRVDHWLRSLRDWKDGVDPTLSLR